MKQAFQAKKLTKLGVAVSLALALSANGASAAEHPLSKNNYYSGSNVNVLDMVMSVDWDFDNPPAGRPGQGIHRGRPKGSRAELLHHDRRQTPDRQGVRLQE